ncbi:TVP38/TMEM64 family protein [Terrarubrum flagellatum]|uniref:TVP38/TMEM64 family protein n=1 Tax=Terrirubrum flagellatum TaxID=2895980 RepID=UPI003144E56B
MSRSGPPPAWRRIAPLAALGLAVLAVWTLRAFDLISIQQLFRERAALRALIDAWPVISIVGFVLAYAAAKVVAVPGVMLVTMAGGFLFGPVMGALAAMTGATLGGVAFCLLARTLFPEFLAKRIDGLTLLRREFDANAVSWMLAMRLTPLFPYIIVNTAAAAFRPPLATFAWTTFLGVAPMSFAAAAAGAGLDQLLTNQIAAFDACVASGASGCGVDWSPMAILTPELIAGLIALAAAALIPVALRRWRGARPEAPSV